MTLLDLPATEARPRPSRTRRRLLTRLAAALVVLALVGAGTVVTVQRLTGLPGNAAFEYGDTVVTRDQLAHRVELLSALYGITQPKGERARASFRRDTAKAVAVSMVLDHAARSRDIVIADKSARDTLASMIGSQLGDGGQAEFTRILGQFGVSERNVLDEIKRQQATARLFQDVTAGIVAGVTAEDARAAFDADPGRYATPEKRHLRNIVVATREEAEAILAAVRSGRAFGALAARRSLDDATRTGRGDLGTVTADALETGYAAAAFAAGAGHTFGPVETKFGWNVGQVLAITPAASATYDQVSSQVLDTVRSERAMAAWRAFVAGEIKRAHVEYADAYRPAHPDAPPTDQPGTPAVTQAGRP